MSEHYLAELDRALRERGTPGRLRTRFLSEARDHLLEAEAERRRVEFGDPAALAQQLVDELASAQAKRSAVISAAVLAPAAAVYALLFVLAGATRGSPDIFSGKNQALALSAALALAIAPQISLAAGSLALLRVFRRRREAVLPGAEVRLLVRRASTALGFGALTVIALAVYAYEYESGLASWWSYVAFSAPLVLAIPLAAATVVLRRTGQLRPAAPGEAGDVFSDLPEARLMARTPWRFCLLFGAAVAAAAFAGGVLGGDPTEGLRNAVAETIAIVTAFAALGKFLGLRS
jgi:hypothetical protein